VLLGAICTAAVPGRVLAQADLVTTSPANIVVPNYNGVPVGPFGGLESSAYVARASDPTAAWFNPAGLSRADGAQITGTAGLYNWTTVSPQLAPSAGGSVQQVPNAVGFTVKSHGLTLGAAFLTRISWQQQTQTQINRRDENGDYLAYSAASQLSQRIWSFSVAYDSTKKWHVGGGLAFSHPSLGSVSTTSERLASPAGLSSETVSAGISGSTFQLQPVLGFQANPHSHLRIGVVVRTPGLPIYSGASLALDGTGVAGAGTVGISLLDSKAQFKYKLPFETGGGLALIGSRAQVEADVQVYSSISPYTLLSSSQNALLFHDAGNGSPPDVTTQPLAGLTSASRTMANISVGGQVQLTKQKPLLLHWGLATDLSPVAPQDQLFDRVDFVSGTIGLSGSAHKFTYAAGVSYRSGSTEIGLRSAVGTAPIETSIRISTFGMLYSLAYAF
jgi:hypothetical protein